MNTLIRNAIVSSFTIISLLSSTKLIASNELTFGSVAMDIPAIMHSRLKPLTVYLSNKLQRPVNLKLSPNMGAAINETASGGVDISYLTPVAYLKSHAKGNSQIIAKTVTNGKASFHLMIVVRKDSLINRSRTLLERGSHLAIKKPYYKEQLLLAPELN